jgi:DNA-binding CsgD family transcriptional regulator
VAFVTSLSGRDLGAVLEVTAEAAAADGEQPFDEPVVDLLRALLRCEYAGYFEYDCPGTTDRFLVDAGDVVCAPPDPFWAHLPEWPLNDELIWWRRTAVKFSDFVSARDKPRHPWYAEVMRPSEIEHECKVMLPSHRHVVRGFFFIRRGGTRDFGERDRAVLNVLRPQLGSIRERWERRRRPDGLTSREVDVVRLLREGLTNQEMAERLVISTGTVRTHLENVFAKLGVHTRTAAVARAFGSG